MEIRRNRRLKSILKQVNENQTLLNEMLSHLEYIFRKHVTTLHNIEKKDEKLKEIKHAFGEKDSILSAYIKVTQMKMKWLELKLAVEKEQARQQEAASKQAAMDSKSVVKYLETANENDDLTPLTDEEWAILSRASFSPSPQPEIAEKHIV